jgi:hypothetical protein
MRWFLRLALALHLLRGCAGIPAAVVKADRPEPLFNRAFTAYGRCQVVPPWFSITWMSRSARNEEHVRVDAIARSVGERSGFKKDTS